MKTRTFTKIEKDIFTELKNRGYKILDAEVYDLDTSKSYTMSLLVEKDGEQSVISLCVTNDLVTQKLSNGAVIYFNI